MGEEGGRVPRVWPLQHRAKIAYDRLLRPLNLHPGPRLASEHEVDEIHNRILLHIDDFQEARRGWVRGNWYRLPVVRFEPKRRAVVCHETCFDYGPIRIEEGRAAVRVGVAYESRQLVTPLDLGF